VEYGVGIDLGTSFTRAAVNNGGQSRMLSLRNEMLLMPSVVTSRPDGTLVPGEDEPTGVEVNSVGRDFKRRLGDPTPLMLGGRPHSAVSLMTATLKSVIEMLVAAEGAAPDRVVLTYPAVWGHYRREQFEEVIRQAGLADVVIMTEPEAAATHYARRTRLPDGALVAIYDLGGGTFDTAIARATRAGIETLGHPEGMEWVGGVDFDAAVFAHVDRLVDGAYTALDPTDPAAAISLDRIRAACIRAKESLSRADSTNIPVQLPTRHTQVRITRSEFEAMIRPSIEATVAALRRSLASAEATPADLSGVLLVGGSSRIPLVSRLLSTELGRPVLVDAHPQHCVALGAAAVAGAGLNQPVAVPPLRPSLRHRRLAAATVVTVLAVGGGTFALHTLSGGSTATPRPAPTQTRVSSTPTSTAGRPGLPGVSSTVSAVNPVVSPAGVP
jgi:molecular chaperone DnaK